ncbi:ladderlectin-like [Epinephelus fuscoguttatus]|uniref:ladderlectin-like n=1 Tax=Epinephelus fuscoguttatus TaxID=293821 RepID=UPI0020D0B72E|nr:ladderlectin-like [Epinephelus fuscoguttatus]
MKTLTVFALLCAMMALTTAAALSEVKDEHGTVEVIQEGEHHVIERSASCPGGWNLINGRCFLFVPRTMTWARAELNCQSMGANLVSVHLAEEYHGITKMIEDKTHGHPQTWLGGSDAEEEGVWLWNDGTRFSFSYWCRGEPNNDGWQHCIQMSYGDNKCWDDTKCHYHLSSVCAKKI